MNRMIKVRVYDVAVFIKENFLEILKTEKDTGYPGILDLVCTWNQSVKEISRYGYYDEKKRYYTPPTSISMEAVRYIFNLDKSDSEFLISSIFLSSIWDYVFFEDYHHQ